MADLLRCYDVFALTSLFEMMPIALLEAIATGLPVVTHDHPVLAWMGGDGGVRVDMAADGALAAALDGMTAPRIEALGRAARAHATATFSADAVIERYIAYYRRIAAVAPG
jgi:glycosyltransferase involved in cell wall biosynthesis